MSAGVPFTAIEQAVANLDAWLDTMRGPGGYGGPVAHWWQQSLLATGASCDWRYEGIVAGYLTLWQRTANAHWLSKAQRAGDDLLAGQLASGNFAASGFEINPSSAGTPHEAACTVALLQLAAALRAAGLEWRPYAAAAQHHLERCAVGRLWDPVARAFRDHPDMPSFVPNKSATLCEALFLQAELSGAAFWVEQYALPTLDAVLAHQVRGGKLDGAIAQNSFGTQVVAKYFPLYIARCVPALLRGFSYTRRERYLGAAIAALLFVLRQVDPHGALPTVVYANGRTARYPSWVAPLGDVLHAAGALQPYGLTPDIAAIEARLLAGQAPSGGINTATGFAGQVHGRPGPLPDVRDLLPVVGWCDKAFRYLAEHVNQLPVAANLAYETDCVFRGRRLRYSETPERIDIRAGRTVRYNWIKGDPRPTIAGPEFWLR